MVYILRQPHAVPLQVHFASHAAKDVQMFPSEVSTFGICQYMNYLNHVGFFKGLIYCFWFLLNKSIAFYSKIKEKSTRSVVKISLHLLKQSKKLTWCIMELREQLF